MSQPKKKHFIGAWIDAETKKKLQSVSKSTDRSLAYTIAKLLSQGVNTAK